MIKITSSVQMCQTLGLLPPTAEQQAIIESPLESALVVAGAGSGKTETVTLRIVWLILSGQLSPEQIVGLTYTRKAAGELAQRVQNYLGRLGGYMDQTQLFAGVKVATYNSFANSIYRAHALRLGHSEPFEPIADSQAWLIARRMLAKISLDERIKGKLDTVADEVVKLADAAADHQVSFEHLCDYLERFCTLFAGGPVGINSKVKPDYEHAQELLALSYLLEDFQLEKERIGKISYSQQVSFALQICREFPEVAEEFQARTAYVVLDEYQDTSPSQAEFLKLLFGRETKVLAVGDPKQAIYGFRGASPSNMSRFPVDFLTNNRYELSISWRNDQRILDLANNVIGWPPQIQFGDEKLAPRPGAGAGALELEVTEDRLQEAQSNAKWLQARLAENPTATAAILVRDRAGMDPAAVALAEAGIPFQRAGENIFSAPEVLDLLSMMRIAANSQATVSLLRLISGGRWQIGLGDLQALAAAAAKQKRREGAGAGISGAVGDAADGAADSSAPAVSDLSLLEVLEGLKLEDTAISSEGQARLRDFIAAFRYAKSMAFLPLPEWVRLIEQILALDIEVEISGRGRGNLEAFHELVYGYEGESLEELLAWFTRLEKNDDLRASLRSAGPGEVQLITVHSAKGLEWDWVVLAGVDRLPAKDLQPSGWLSGQGTLPGALRLDHEDLPEFKWYSCENYDGYEAARSDYRRQLEEHKNKEEKNLFYVAVTRAKRGLRLSGIKIKPPKLKRGEQPPENPRPAGINFLWSVAEFMGIDPQSVMGAGAQASPDAAGKLETAELADPAAAAEPAPRTLLWPLDALGSRRAAAEQAAAAVRDAAGDELDQGLSALIDTLLAEDTPPEAEPQKALSATSLVRSSARRRIPRRPLEAAGLGTDFHAWVENYYQSQPQLPLEAAADSKLQRLWQNFLRSEWSGSKPLQVEKRLQWSVGGGRIISCVIDAVFRKDDGFTIVDWKSGSSKNLHEQYRIQVSVYRLAFAQWQGVDPAKVETKIYFAADNKTVTVEPYSASELGEKSELLAEIFDPSEDSSE